MRYNLSKLEHVIYNDGERLLPGITHSMEEVVRHRSSYQFFVDAIVADLRHSGDLGKRNVSILDLGFGTGHGCEMLARVPCSRVLGIDNSPACARYARRYYSAPNVTYRVVDIPAFLRSAEPFDYVVSRGVIEHIPDGIEVATKANWTQRLLFDVPFDEPAGINQHHVVSGVTAKSFEKYSNVEIYYEEVGGEIYLGEPREEKPNMIMCVSSKGSLPSLSSLLDLPRKPWHTESKMADLAPRVTWLHKLSDLCHVPRK